MIIDKQNVCPNCGCSGRMQQHIPTDKLNALDKYFEIWIFCSDENCGRKVYGKCLHGNASEMKKCYKSVKNIFYSTNNGGIKLTKYIYEYFRGGCEKW